MMQKTILYFFFKILLKYYPSDQQAIKQILQSLNKKIFPLVQSSRNNERYSLIFNMTVEEYQKEALNLINNIIIYLKKDNRIIIANLLEKMLKNMDIEDVLTFIFSDKHSIPNSFKNINFTKEETYLLNSWIVAADSNNQTSFFNCSFNVDFETIRYLKINESFFNREKIGFCIFDFANKEDFNNCYLTADSYANNKVKKIPGTPFTCQTSAYIKLGNLCNGSCPFCKNKSENVVPPNLDNIINSLFNEKIINHINQIYFGGGEPSLYIKEIKTILDEFEKRKIEEPDWYIFTNGSGNWHDINQLRVGKKGKIILSRQEIEDKDNEKIMGVTYSLNDPILDNLMHRRKVLLSLTYSEENMRENFLQEYIQFGYSYGIRDFIIQDLEEKSRQYMYNSDEHFKKLEIYLEENGYKKTARIASTSYFNLNIFRKPGYSISLKRYFPPSKLKEQFKFCPKHSFDLGIDANGDFYEDFQMIKKLEL